MWRKDRMIAERFRRRSRTPARALFVFMAGTLLAGCSSGGIPPTNEMLRGGIPAGMGLVYGRIYPGQTRVHLLNRTTKKRHSITTDENGDIFALLPAGDYAAEEFRRTRTRIRQVNMSRRNNLRFPPVLPFTLGASGSLSEKNCSFRTNTKPRPESSKSAIRICGSLDLRKNRCFGPLPSGSSSSLQKRCCCSPPGIGHLP